MDKRSKPRRKQLAQIKGKRRFTKCELFLPLECVHFLQRWGRWVEGAPSGRAGTGEDKFTSHIEKPLSVCHWARLYWKKNIYSSLTEEDIGYTAVKNVPNMRLLLIRGNRIIPNSSHRPRTSPVPSTSFLSDPVTPPGRYQTHFAD